MQIWIDVEDAAGTRYGSGPITTASEWQSTRRLDGAGTFAFSMPAADPRSNLLAHKRIVRCWRSDGMGIYEVGSGIIDAITVTPGDGNNPTMLQISGDDLLRELANRTLGDLYLFEDVEYTPWLQLVREGYPTTTITPPASISLAPGVDKKYLYVGLEKAFSRITFTISQGNYALTDTFQVQYYNINEQWETPGGLINNTREGGPDPNRPELGFPFLKSGTVEFDVPSEWAALDGWYYIRFFDHRANLDTITMDKVTVTVVEPVSDGLQRIMALAPDGWSLDPGGKFATATPVYMQFSGESILSALVLLAEQTGEHFLLSPTARRLWWIGTDKLSSGVRAVQATETSNNTMLISQLQRSSDSYDLYTRAYAYGGGEGVGRLTMEKTTRDVSGYTLASDGTYLEADNAVASYGRIDNREDYPDIVPVNNSDVQIVYAANTLFDRVYNALRRKSQLQYAYSLELVPSVYQVWPGQTMYVDYHEWVDSYHAVNIAAELWVLESTVKATPEGLRLLSVLVATVDYAPTNDARAMAELMGLVRRDRSATLPATAFSSGQVGTPVFVNVSNGRVTSIGRVKPVDDGWYPVSEISQIKTVNGVIVAIEAA